VAVLFVDVDRFKVINDSLGHGAGDRLLATLAERMRHALRPTDVLARFGGDEFVLVCEDFSGERDVAALADRLLDVLGQRTDIDGRGVVVDVSIGVAVTSSAAARAEDLVRDADAAMYRAKGRGGGSWELFDEELRAHAVARLDVEDALRRALDGGQLRVFYQPVVTLDERPVSAEALVRWQHPVRGLISPADFIPLAEETGLIVPLGRFVLEEACRQLARWRRADPALEGLAMAVNLSARQLADPGLCEWVRAVLERNALDPSSLCLEITESVLVDDAGTAAESLLALNELGVRLAVDDFGTGYSSLLSLRRFPVQELKLDRSFVSGLGRNDRDTAIVGSVIQLAHALGLLAVAEGVETEEQLASLRSLGCDRAQGYLWSPPVPADEAGGFLSARRAQNHDERPGQRTRAVPVTASGTDA
jgi:diguanylate cyclase (GGDEF)-like protein